VHGAVLREFGKRVEARSLDAIPAKVAGDHYKDLQARVSETTAQIHVRALRAFFNAHKKICRTNPFADLELAKIDQPARVVFCTKIQRPPALSNPPRHLHLDARRGIDGAMPSTSRSAASCEPGTYFRLVMCRPPDWGRGATRAGG
jgi:hypothetical protein